MVQEVDVMTDYHANLWYISLEFTLEHDCADIVTNDDFTRVNQYVIIN